MGDIDSGRRNSMDETYRAYYLKILHDTGFDHQLAIPESLAACLKKKVVDTVTLKGPRSFTWTVGLTLKECTLFFDRGWQKFVQENLLEQHDLLLLKYSGVSHFDVLMFDGKSLCEKTAPYFIRRCGEHENGSCEKGKSLKNYICSDCAAKQKHVGSQDANPSSLKNQLSHFRLGQSLQETMKLGGGMEISRPIVDGIRTKEDSRSSRRDVTEDEKAKALTLARSAKTNKGFLVVMKPSHVSQYCAMTIPAKWMNKNLSKEIKDVILSMNGINWPTKLYYNRSKKYVALRTGWRHFVMDNDLHEFDVCVFEPAYPATYSVLLNTTIFPSRNPSSN